MGAPAEAVSLESSTVLDLRDGCIDLIGVILTGLLSEASVDDDLGVCKLVGEVPSTGTRSGDGTKGAILSNSSRCLMGHVRYCRDRAGPARKYWICICRDF